MSFPRRWETRTQNQKFKKRCPVVLGAENRLLPDFYLQDFFCIGCDFGKFTCTDGSDPDYFLGISKDR